MKELRQFRPNQPLNAVINGYSQIIYPLAVFVYLPSNKHKLLYLILDDDVWNPKISLVKEIHQISPTQINVPKIKSVDYSFTYPANLVVYLVNFNQDGKIINQKSKIFVN